jgi:hypothetical protein
MRWSGDKRSRLPSLATAIALVALVLAMSGFAVAATSSGGGGVIHGCVVKAGEEKGLLRVVGGSSCPEGQRSIAFDKAGPRGPAGPAGQVGPPGERGSAGAAATNLAPPPLEAIHFVGAPGEPGFEPGAGNAGSTSVPKAGFYKDQLGIVHIQGEVKANQRIFVLPEGFRPSNQVCASAPAFKSGASVFVTNRVCVNPAGLVLNDRGEGTEFIALNALAYRVDN